MRERLNLINCLAACDSVLAIISHRLLVNAAQKGEVPGWISSFFQVSMIAFVLLFMMVFAGLAVYGWKKANTDPAGLDKFPEFPKVSFGIAVAAIVVFTIYWMI